MQRKSFAYVNFHIIVYYLSMTCLKLAKKKKSLQIMTYLESTSDRMFRVLCRAGEHPIDAGYDFWKCYMLETNKIAALHFWQCFRVCLATVQSPWATAKPWYKTKKKKICSRF